MDLSSRVVTGLSASKLGKMQEEVHASKRARFESVNAPRFSVLNDTLNSESG